jgi:DNA-binding response OmpR family regulator
MNALTSPMIQVRPESAAKLLLIEDDNAIQLLMRTIFHRRGMLLDCVGDGDTALQRLRRTRYDVVILDLMLPGANGFEIVREMKSRDRALLDRTIILTAASEAMLRDFADGQLVRRVIRKPFDLDEFVAEVLALTPHRTAPAEQYVQ